jgi:hypothetical protein
MVQDPGVAAGVFLIPCSSPANGEISIGCADAVAPVG